MQMGHTGADMYITGNTKRNREVQKRTQQLTCTYKTHNNSTQNKIDYNTHNCRKNEIYN